MSTWDAPDFLLDALVKDVFDSDNKKTTIQVYRPEDRVVGYAEDYPKLNNGTRVTFSATKCYIQISINGGKFLVYKIAVDENKGFEILRSSLVNNKKLSDLSNRIAGFGINRWEQVTQLARSLEAWNQFVSVLFRLEDKFGVAIMDKVEL